MSSWCDPSFRQESDVVVDPVSLKAMIGQGGPTTDYNRRSMRLYVKAVEKRHLRGPANESKHVGCGASELCSSPV